jgi:hypothetical protein
LAAVNNPPDGAHSRVNRHLIVFRDPGNINMP